MGTRDFVACAGPLGLPRQVNLLGEDMVGGFSFKKLLRGTGKVVAAPVKLTGTVLSAPGRLLEKALPKPFKPLGSVLALQGRFYTAAGQSIERPKSAPKNFVALSRHVGTIAGSPVIRVVGAGAGMAFGVPPQATLGALGAASLLAAKKIDLAALARNPEAIAVISGTVAGATAGNPDLVRGVAMLNQARKLRGAIPIKLPSASVVAAKAGPSSSTAARRGQPTKRAPLLLARPKLKRLAAAPPPAKVKGFGVSLQGKVTSGSFVPDSSAPPMWIASERRARKGNYRRVA
jgi:hypothetical protein